MKPQSPTDSMQLDEVKISCLVCTADGPPSLDELFDSLAAQDWILGDELILVDAGMAPERRTQMEARVAQFAEAGIAARCETEPQPGDVHARIKAILASTNSWLLSLSDTNLVGPESLRQIRRRLSKHPALGGICPRIEPVWEVKPPPWVVALGHQVLSYNTSGLHEPSYAWQLWEPGIIGKKPPMGGMVIARSVALEFVQLCNEAPLLLSFSGEDGHGRAAEAFVLYSLIYKNKELVTAYDDSIIVRRHIPRADTTFSHLASAMFRSNYSFALLGLMRFGKVRFIDILARGLGRLVFEFFQQTKQSMSIRIVLGYAAGAAGFIYGTFAGLGNRECVRIQIDP